jgi:hypothetical protein
MRYWWPFIVSATLYTLYKVFKLWEEYPNEISWQDDDKADENEM